MKFLIVCGPTCTGKTGLGIKLANRYNGEIINSDSRQIYKHTTIGTAKPTDDEMSQAKHHLYDFCELDEVFSAYRYAEMARDLMNDFNARGVLPVVVGGTGLYLKALTEGIFKSPKPDAEYRKRLDEIVEKYGIEKLHDMLKLVDEKSADRLKRTDTARLYRALEIHHQTGQSISELQQTGEYLPSIGEPLWLGLTYNRKELYERINIRVDTMLKAGFEDEVKKLEPFLDSIRKRKMIGYTDMVEYLFDNKISRDIAIEKVKQHHRNYAKRQLTWFRKVSQINWFDPSQEDFESSIYEISDNYIKNA